MPAGKEGKTKLENAHFVPPETSRSYKQLLGNSTFLTCQCKRKPWLSQLAMGAPATSSVKVFYTLIVGNQGLGDGPVGKCSLCKFKELTMSLAHMLKAKHGGSIMESKHRGDGDRGILRHFWPSSLLFPGLMRDLVSKLIRWGLDRWMNSEEHLLL